MQDWNIHFSSRKTTVTVKHQSMAKLEQVGIKHTANTMN
jgi:hypothetical protein